MRKQQLQLVQSVLTKLKSRTDDLSVASFFNFVENFTSSDGRWTWALWPKIPNTVHTHPHCQCFLFQAVFLTSFKFLLLIFYCILHPNKVEYLKTFIYVCKRRVFNGFFRKKAGKPPQICNIFTGLAVNKYLTQQPER